MKSTLFNSYGKVDIKEISKNIAYCGLVCSFCHLSDKCDGCKSDKNCCGKHLREEGCYQYNCCVEKEINGCWECGDFPCGEDMFSDSHDIRLQAFVRCAKEEGIEKLAEYVIRNQQNGILYGHNKDYDNLGSEENVMHLLKTGQK
jgi:hypothetical protein